MTASNVVGARTRALLGPKDHSQLCDIASRLGRDMESAPTAGARQGAEAVARALVLEADRTVREFLAHSLRETAELPADIATALARDLDSICQPFLASTQVFSEPELARMAETLDDAALAGMARRPRVGRQLSQVIAQRGSEHTAVILSGNQGSHLTPDCLDTLLERFTGTPSVMGALARRPEIPVEYLERVLAEVSEAIQKEVVAFHDLPDGGRRILDRANARALFHTIKCAPESKVVEHVSWLYLRGELKTEAMIEALRERHLLFFEVGLSRMTGLPIDRVRRQLRDPAKLAGMCRQARFSDALTRRVQGLVAAALKPRDTPSR